MGKPLLTIDDLERNTIKIFGVEYEILSPEDFGLVESAELNQTCNRIMSVRHSSEIPNPDQAEEAASALDQFVKTIIPSLPEEKRHRLNDRQRMKIMYAFMVAVGWIGPGTPLAARAAQLVSALG